MQVLNIHERKFQATSERVGSLLDSLSSPTDALWPKQSWPAMKFDRPLAVGAVGGHGPIQYSVESYTPGRSIVFRFLGPKGFDGCHRFEIIAATDQPCVLRHTIEMQTHGLASLKWLIIIRPLHDALLEDSLDTAQASLGLVPEIHQWSLRVRFLRWLLSKGQTRKQRMPTSTAKNQNS
jgi:hypothetical protein